MNAIKAYRNFYANFITASARAANERLVAAFSSVERERFLGKGPWSIWAGSRYLETPSDDPRLLYQDVVVGLAPERGINNGQPTLHARCLAACGPAAGDVVVHIGAGTGYYTAVLAVLVGPGGTVMAYEIEADLAARARENLRQWPNVKLENISATQGALPEANVIYVNAGATHPPAAWLDALQVGGRLLLPLTTDSGAGVMLLVTRRGLASYAARVLTPTAFIPCAGARDQAAGQALTTAIKTGAIMKAQSLHRGTAPDATACCAGDGWWLSSAAPG